MSEHMTHEEAHKTLKDRKKPETYIRVNFNYNNYLIFPFKEGMAYIEALKSAEVFEDCYTGPPKINPVDSNTITVTLLSQQEYQLIHMAKLMGISTSDVSGIPF